MTVAVKQLDARKYGRLLLRVLPVVIQTEEEYDRIDAEIGSLLQKGHGQLVPEERALLELLTKLIEDYDAQHYAFPKGQSHESAQPAPSLSDGGLDEFMADLETLAEGTEHLPPSTLTYSRADIYFDHD